MNKEEQEAQKRKFTMEPGDIVITRLSDVVPKYKKSDMIELLGKDLYDEIVDNGFNGPAFDTDGIRVTVMSLERQYGKV